MHFGGKITPFRLNGLKDFGTKWLVTDIFGRLWCNLREIVDILHSQARVPCQRCLFFQQAFIRSRLRSSAGLAEGFHSTMSLSSSGMYCCGVKLPG